MMALKRAFAAALLIFGLALLGAAGAWLFVEDSTLVSLLARRVESLSDTRISYQEGASISRTWAPELRVDKLVVDDGQARFRIETSFLRLQNGLAELLRGRLDVPHLLVGDTRVNLLKRSVPDEPAAEETEQATLSINRIMIIR